MAKNEINKQPLAVILGPTAVGKTEVALKVARQLGNTEIVSADSMQVYRYMNIGTAKPPIEQQGLIKHHLIDLVNPDDDYSVADYQKAALNIINNIQRRGKLPLMVGGPGLYIKAVTDNYTFCEQGKNPQIRANLKEKAIKMGASQLYEDLSLVDPQSALKIHPHDLRRIIRALEVYYSTGKPISAQWEQTKNKPGNFRLLMIGLTMERDELYERINKRVDYMFEKGLLDEVKNLIARGYSPALKSMQSIGYSHICRYLAGELSLPEVKKIFKRDTRRFAKRQFTWFKRDPRIYWLKIEFARFFPIVAKICSMVEGELNLYRE